MNGLLNYKAICKLKYDLLRLNAPPDTGGANWDNVANMYNEMTQMEKTPQPTPFLYCLSQKKIVLWI